MDTSNIHIDESEGYKRYKRLCRQFNTTPQAGQDPSKGIRRIRFINKNIDKTAPNWTRSNMIEVYDLTLCCKEGGYTVGLTDYEEGNTIVTDYPDDEGLKRKDFRQIESPFISPINIIQEVFSPFLICKEGEVLYDIESLYTSFGELRNIFEYDYENGAYVVNDIKDIINTEMSSEHSCYKKLSPHIEQDFSRFFWGISYSYIPIKTNEPIKETSSAWL